MDSPVRVLATMPEELNETPVTHMMKKRLDFYKSSDLHGCTMAVTPTYLHAHPK